MILFLYGSDTYRLQEELNDLKDRFIKKQGKMNLQEIDLDDAEVGKVFESIQSLSLFASTRFVIIKNLLHNTSKLDQEKLLQILPREEKSKELVICFFEKGGGANTKLYQYLKKLKHAKRLETLQGLELSKFAKQLAKKKECDIEPQALEMLVIRSRGDVWWIAQALEQLYAYTDGKKIAVRDVQALTTLRVTPDIFRTIDAIAEKKGETALRLLHEHLNDGEDANYLLSMINYQFSNLIQVKELAEAGKQTHEIEKITKLHPYVVKKTYQQSARFNLRTLAAIFNKLAEADMKVKRGRVDPKVILDILVIGLTS